MRVLLVEDEASVVTGVRRALEAEGYDVAVASDGREGLNLLLDGGYDVAPSPASFETPASPSLNLLLDGGYDVAILDVLLPGMNGYELCRTARRHGVQASILMLTAKSGEWDVAEGLDLGADDYITKPFSVVELLARIRARVRGPGGAAGLEVGDLRLEPPARRCWRGDTEIELTGRETSLLAVLFRNAPGAARR